eukprot:Nk52_evm3s545 gene=Nk52_evmTU3s545
MTDPVLEYDFDSNSKWKSYLENVTVSSEMSDTVLLKLKRKWYTKNIDPEYVPTQQASSSGQSRSTEANTSSTTANASAGGATSSSSTSSSPPPGYTASSSSGAAPSFSNSSSSSSSSSGQSGIANLRNYVVQQKLPSIWWLAHIFLLLNAAAYMVMPMSAFSIDCYRRAFKGGLVSYAISIFQRHGQPQMSQLYLQRVTSDESFHFLLYCVVFLTSAPLTMVLIPVCVYSLFHFTQHAKHIATLALPTQTSLRQKIVGYLSLLDGQRDMLGSFAAYVEVFILPTLVIQWLFFGHTGFLTLIIYAQFLHGRYVVSVYSRAAFHSINIEIEKFMNGPMCPTFIRNGYLKAVAMLQQARQQAAQYQQQYQQQQQG